MLALMFTLLGIGLVAALALGGVSLFQGSVASRTQVRDSSIAAFQGVAAAYQAYLTANRVAPAVASWQTQLVPAYLSELKVPAQNLSWTYAIDGTFGAYLCLSGSMTQPTYLGFNDASGAYPTNSYYINNSTCGSRTNSAAPSSWPTTLYVTYWLRGS